MPKINIKSNDCNEPISSIENLNFRAFPKINIKNPPKKNEITTLSNKK